MGNIQYFDDGKIKKDHNICDDAPVYLDHGQSCRTIWFKTVNGARKALAKDGVMHGKQLFDCSKCDNHYSVRDKKSGHYPSHACGPAKEEYRKQFED